jgi:hypothetical protein
MNPRTKFIALATGAAALSIVGGAAAHGGNGGHGSHHATVYGGALAKTAAATDPAYAETKGRAHLVDGTKHNPLVIHVRHLKPSTAYTFQLSTAPCDQTSAPVADFATTSATANEDGNLRGKADSNTFQAADGATYSVVVNEGTTAIACGELKVKHAKHKHKHKHKNKPEHPTFKLNKGHDDSSHHRGDDQR